MTELPITTIYVRDPQEVISTLKEGALFTTSDDHTLGLVRSEDGKTAHILEYKGDVRKADGLQAGISNPYYASMDTTHFIQAVAIAQKQGFDKSITLKFGIRTIEFKFPKMSPEELEALKAMPCRVSDGQGSLGTGASVWVPKYLALANAVFFRPFDIVNQLGAMKPVAVVNLAKKETVTATVINL